jgi:hypothetical protein
MELQSFRGRLQKGDSDEKRYETNRKEVRTIGGFRGASALRDSSWQSLADEKPVCGKNSSKLI